MIALPDFPWDALTPYAEVARAHGDGLVDLSVGTPTDSTPAVLQDALRAAADAPGYPTAAGTPDLRAAASAWLSRRIGVECPPAQIVPTIGSKEAVALLALLLGRHGKVLVPGLAYPTYEVGALVAGCTVERVPLVDGLLDIDSVDPTGAALLWLNYPANPHGRVAPSDHVRDVVAWARQHGVLVASDECYIELGYDAEPTSALCEGTQGVVALHSMSKRSTAAGYRGGLLSGDATAIRQLHELRRHLGLLVPTPVQAAMTAALGDDAHVQEARSRYARRRTTLRAALDTAGWRVDHSEGGLYLWATFPGRDAWGSVQWLAERGVLVAPGTFYGPEGRDHVRIALTAPDEQIAAAAARLTGDAA